jgi:hypothetical protein
MRKSDILTIQPDVGAGEQPTARGMIHAPAAFDMTPMIVVIAACRCMTLMIGFFSFGSKATPFQRASVTLSGKV